MEEPLYRTLLLIPASASETTSDNAIRYAQEADLDVVSMPENAMVLRFCLQKLVVQQSDAQPARATVLDLSVPYAELRRGHLEELEFSYLDQLLRATEGNLAAASRVSGQDRKSLWRLMQRHGIDVEDYRTE